MKAIFTYALLAFAPLHAGTVVVTSVGDDSRPLSGLISKDGTPLSADVEIRIGGFPGLTDDALLDKAASEGYAGVVASFVAFGDPKHIGDGVLDSNGDFEVVNQADVPALEGENISVLISKDGGQEFFVARFADALFQGGSDTSLESVVSLHLADAKVVIGNRYGSTMLATSSTPAVGSFATWIDSFPGLLETLPSDDPDRDGRSNILEYGTGGNPGLASDPPDVECYQGGEGDFWFRFRRQSGIGTVSLTIVSAEDLESGWQELIGPIEIDPDPPVSGGFEWMRVKVPTPLKINEFFRLVVEE